MYSQHDERKAERNPQAPGAMSERSKQPVRPTSREAILEAALTVFSNDPGASLAQVSQRAGVGRATLHRHFESRNALVRELALMSIREIDEAVEGLEDRADTAIELLELVIDAIMPLGDRFHFLSIEHALLEDPEIDEHLARQLGQLTGTIDRAKKDGAIDPGVPTPWIVATIDALIYTAWTLAASGDIARKQTTTLIMRTVVSGFGAPRE